jgi:hypothetical protein
LFRRFVASSAAVLDGLTDDQRRQVTEYGGGGRCPPGQQDVTDVDGVSVVVMVDDQGDFERVYPQTRTKCDCEVCPR